VPISAACAKAHTIKVATVASRWQRVGDLIGSGIKVATVASRWQRVGDLIGSGFKPHTSRTRSERLTTCAIRPVEN